MGWGNKKAEVNKEEYAGVASAEVPQSGQASVATDVASASPNAGSAGASGWKKVESGAGGNFFKFEKVGEELTGTYLGEFDGGMSPFGKRNRNAKIQSGNDVAIVSMTANLARQMETLKAGVEVKIVYNGKKLNAKNHNYYHDFSVYTQ